MGPRAEAITAVLRAVIRNTQRVDPPRELQAGSFFPLQAFELESLGLLEADKLDRVIDAVNSTGYGLTLGAVVGAQPFGGEGLSGTGPKAGGPYYLQRKYCSGGWQYQSAITA